MSSNMTTCNGCGDTIEYAPQFNSISCYGCTAQFEVRLNAHGEGYLHFLRFDEEDVAFTRMAQVKNDGV